MIKPVSYLQGDSKWGKHDYSAKGESKTISSSGCGPTSAAMIVQTLRPDIKITPVEAADWAKARGYKYKNQGTAYSFFMRYFAEFGIICRQINDVDARSASEASKARIFTQVKEALRTEGKFVIACMGPGLWTKGGHYIVAYSMDNEYVYINDPASTQPYRLKNSIKLFLDQAKYFWIIKWGTSNKVQKRGKLYSKKDVLSKKLGDLFTSEEVWVVKDCKDGWSICCSNMNVGYVKNNRLHMVGKSKFPEYKINKECNLRQDNSRMSASLMKLVPGDIVRVETKRKFWSHVIVELEEFDARYKGWVKTKFIDFK